MKNIDANGHVRGESLFLDDFIVKQNTLHAAVLAAPVAHAEGLKIDTTDAERLPGVVKVLLAADIPGENEIGGILLDEPLLAETEIHFQGQPLAIVVAESQFIAKKSQITDWTGLSRVTCYHHSATGKAP